MTFVNCSRHNSVLFGLQNTRKWILFFWKIPIFQTSEHHVCHNPVFGILQLVDSESKSGCCTLSWVSFAWFWSLSGIDSPWSSGKKIWSCDDLEWVRLWQRTNVISDRYSLNVSFYWHQPTGVCGGGGAVLEIGRPIAKFHNRFRQNSSKRAQIMLNADREALESDLDTYFAR